LTAAEARLLNSEVRLALRRIQTDLGRIIAHLDAVDAALAADRIPRRLRRT
jgi:hypothetical protein